MKTVDEGSGERVVGIIEDALQEHHLMLVVDVRASIPRLSALLERLERHGVLAYREPFLQSGELGVHVDLGLARAIALSKALDGMKARAKGGRAPGV